MTKPLNETFTVDIIALDGSRRSLTLDIVDSFNNLCMPQYLPDAVARYIFRKIYAYYENRYDLDKKLWAEIVDYLKQCHPYYSAFLQGRDAPLDIYCRDLCINILYYLYEHPDFSDAQEIIVYILDLYFPAIKPRQNYFYDYWHAHWLIAVIDEYFLFSFNAGTAFKGLVFLQALQNYCLKFYHSDYSGYMMEATKYFCKIFEPETYKQRFKLHSRRGTETLFELLLHQLMELASRNYTLHRCKHCECPFISSNALVREPMKAIERNRLGGTCPVCDRSGRDKSKKEPPMYADFRSYFNQELTNSLLLKYNEKTAKEILDMLYGFTKNSDSFYLWGGRLIAYIKRGKLKEPDEDLLEFCRGVKKQEEEKKQEKKEDEEEKNEEKNSAVKAVFAEFNPLSYEEIEKCFEAYETYRKHDTQEKFEYPRDPVWLNLPPKSRIRTLKEVNRHEHNP